MRIFVISDTHFNHCNIISYCHRPFKNVADMNDFMIARWNAMVSKEDIVIHLGDFGFGTKEILKDICMQLNGRKVLIKGNHDLRKGNGFWLDCGFELVYKKSPVFLYELLQDLKVPKFLTNIDNKIILSHYPQNITEDQLNIHGHIHNSPLDLEQFKEDNHICVSVEMLDYKPKEIISLVKEWSEKKYE